MRFVKESLIRATPERVFAFHEQPRALELLLPPWETAHIVERAQISQEGSRAVIDTKIFGLFKVRWIALHTAYDPPRSFEDVQVKGPFRSWRHHHIVKPHETGALLRDEIDYEPPLGFLGKLFAPLLVERRLQRLFDYRHEATRKWCEEN
ncbi:MAG: SRPBCC family protein [Pyrinomonadaceae bacterium]